MLILRVLATCVVIASCIGHVLAGFPWSQKVIELSSINPVIHASIDPYTTQPSHEQKIPLSNTLAKVKQTLDSLETMPSCKKLAALDLVNSCESFEDHHKGQQSSGDNHLEIFQKLFAIRITNCEQLDANDVLPNVCQALLEIDSHSQALPDMISSCLEALNSGHPNQWTTYRHVKAEGLIMCAAMRAEANKDDNIHLLRILIGTMTDVNGAINMQKEELEVITSDFKGLGSRMRDLQTAMLHDNQRMKDQMKDISAELTGSMTGINEDAQVVLQMVKDIYEHTRKVQSELGSAMQLANTRNDETDAQWAAKLEDRESTLVVVLNRFGFALQNKLDAYHAGIYSMSNSIETANAQTSVLTTNLGELLANLPTNKLAAVNSVADELDMKFNRLSKLTDGTLEIAKATHEITDKTLESAKRTRELLSFFFNFTKTVYDCFRGALGQWFSFSLYCAFIFLMALSCLWKVFPRLIALCVSLLFAVVFGACFAWVRTPATFVRSILAHHPTFFSPVIWSVLTTTAVGIFLYESARKIYRYVSPLLRVPQELRLPVNEYDGENEKF